MIYKCLVKDAVLKCPVSTLTKAGLCVKVEIKS